MATLMERIESQAELAPADPATLFVGSASRLCWDPFRQIRCCKCKCVKNGHEFRWRLKRNRKTPTPRYTCRKCERQIKRQWLETPSGQDYRRRRRNEYSQKTRGTIKVRARMKARNALHRGRIEKRPCGRCGTVVGVEMHHDDYTRPLHVAFLCRPCHESIHTANPEKSWKPLN